MKIEKRKPKSVSVATKLTEEQNAKLVKLAEKHEITKSALIAHLIELGYKAVTRNKTF